MTAEEIEKRHQARMQKIYAKRGRTRSKAILRVTTDPKTGKKLYQVYVPE